MRLGDLCSLYDGPHQTAPLTPGGPVVYLNVGDIQGGRIDLRMSGTVSEDTARQWSKRVAPEPGDVVFGYEAKVGEAAVLQDSHRWCLGRRVALLRARRDLLDPRFLAYAWRAPAFQETLRANLISGSTIESIRLTDLPSWTLYLPPTEEQRAIADILGALDDKIELNRRMSVTLEAMARALFKSWFVDFDPVRERGESGDGSLSDGPAALFPTSFSRSDQGDLPMGWRTSTLSEVAGEQRRLVPAGALDPSVPYVGLEHIPRRSITLADWATAEGLASGKTSFRRGEILFGKLRPYFHKVVVAPVDGVCSTDIVVVAPRDERWFGFVLGHLSSDAFVGYTDAHSGGTKMPRTNWRDMSMYPVVLPPPEVAAEFSRLVAPIVQRLRVAAHESRTLATLRDTLLPKLISGELRVPDAERIAVEAGA